jgi:hypothetical protein
MRSRPSLIFAKKSHRSGPENSAAQVLTQANPVVYFFAMKGHTILVGKSLILVSMASLALVLAAGPTFSADQATDTGKTALASSIAREPAAPASPAAQASPAAKTSLKGKVKAALQKVNPMRLLRDREYQKASVLFPAFCKDWERKLHDREVNNQSHIAWQQKDGWETGTYTGYSPVQKCECHQSTDGYSIGKVTYQEFQYYIFGKTADDAKHATPKVTDITATTELFRWDKEMWFY